VKPSQSWISPSPRFTSLANVPNVRSNELVSNALVRMLSVLEEQAATAKQSNSYFASLMFGQGMGRMSAFDPKLAWTASDRLP